MTTTTKKLSASAQLADTLSAILARPPVKAGMRLLPERELGMRLGLGFKCVHRALEMLTAAGILSKRHGSGNYVRKIPFAAMDAVPALTAADIFPASELQEDEPARLTSLPQQQRLRLQLWSGFHLPDSENYSLWRKILEHVELAGHEIMPRTLFAADGRPLTADEIAQQLREDPADGYLVSSPLGQVFQDGCRTAFAGVMPPMIFISLWSHNFQVEPSVRQDGVNAICRAVQCFAEQGMRRIAFLGYDEKYHTGEIDYLAYDFAMRLQHLEYRCGTTVPWRPEAGRDAVVAMLKSAEPPEAIFIADDHLVAEVDEALAAQGRRLGRNFAGIAISNKNFGNTVIHQWTSIELNRDLLGPLAVDALLKSLLVAGAEIRSVSLLGLWRFRDTHLKDMAGRN